MKQEKYEFYVFYPVFGKKQPLDNLRLMAI